MFCVLLLLETFKSHVRRDFFQAAAVLLPLQAAHAEEALPSISFVLVFFKPEEERTLART